MCKFLHSEQVKINNQKVTKEYRHTFTKLILKVLFKSDRSLWENVENIFEIT